MGSTQTWDDNSSSSSGTDLTLTADSLQSTIQPTVNGEGNHHDAAMTREFAVRGGRLVADAMPSLLATGRGGGESATTTHVS